MKIVILVIFLLGCAPQPSSYQAFTPIPPDPAEVKAREERYQAERASRAKQANLEMQIRWKDQEKWFNIFRNAGYTDEEAAYKAQRMVSRPSRW